MQRVYDLFDRMGFNAADEMPNFFNCHLKKYVPFTRFQLPLRLPNIIKLKGTFDPFFPPPSPCFAPLTTFPCVEEALAGDTPPPMEVHGQLP